MITQQCREQENSKKEIEFGCEQRERAQNPKVVGSLASIICKTAALYVVLLMSVVVVCVVLLLQVVVLMCGVVTVCLSAFVVCLSCLSPSLYLDILMITDAYLERIFILRLNLYIRTTNSCPQRCQTLNVKSLCLYFSPVFRQSFLYNLSLSRSDVT